MQPHQQEYIPSGPSESRQVRELALTYLAEAASIGDRVLFQRRMSDLTSSIIDMRQSSPGTVSPKPSATAYCSRQGFPSSSTVAEDPRIDFAQQYNSRRPRHAVVPDQDDAAMTRRGSMPVHFDGSLRIPSNSGLLKLRELRASLQSSVDSSEGGGGFKGRGHTSTAAAATDRAHRENAYDHDDDANVDHDDSASMEASAAEAEVEASAPPLVSSSAAYLRPSAAPTMPAGASAHSGAASPALSIGEKVLLLQSFFVNAAKGSADCDGEVCCSVETLKLRLISDKSMKKLVGDQSVMNLLCTIYPMSDGSAVSLAEFMSLAVPCLAPNQTAPATVTTGSGTSQQEPHSGQVLNTETDAGIKGERGPSQSAAPAPEVVLSARALESLGTGGPAAESEGSLRYSDTFVRNARTDEYKRCPVDSFAVRRTAAAPAQAAAPPAKSRHVPSSLDLSGLSAEKIFQLAGGSRK